MPAVGTPINLYTRGRLGVRILTGGSIENVMGYTLSRTGKRSQATLTNAVVVGYSKARIGSRRRSSGALVGPTTGAMAGLVRNGLRVRCAAALIDGPIPLIPPSPILPRRFRISTGGAQAGRIGVAHNKGRVGQGGAQ